MNTSAKLSPICTLAALSKIASDREVPSAGCLGPAARGGEGSREHFESLTPCKIRFAPREHQP